jgi:hypothetical protein
MSCGSLFPVIIKRNTAGKAWVRFGIQYSAASAPGAAEVTLALSYAACGKMVGSWRGQLASESTADSFVALTPFIPALLADKIQAAMIVSSQGTSSTGFRARIVVRYAAAMTAVPSTWTDTTDTGSTGPVERNTNLITLTTGGNLYAQLGLAYSSATSGTLATADLAVAVGARRT